MTKLSRQQRRALERSQKKSESKTHSTLPYFVYGPFKSDEVAQHESSAFSHYIRAIDDIHTIKESEELWTGGWVNSNTILEFAGRKIPGMVYFGKPPILELEFGETKKMSSLYIDPHLEIAESVGKTKYNMTTVLIDYDKLLPVSRANYLDWLATGKCDERYSEAYMVLYFCGLEWFYFKSEHNDENEKLKVKREIYRLYEKYGLGAFGMMLSKAVAYFEREDFNLGIFETEQVFIRTDRMYNFAIEGGIKTLSNTPLNGFHAYAVLISIHDSKIEPFREVCPYVFEKLFVEKFDQQYPNGLTITKPEGTLTNTYQSEQQKFLINGVVKYAGNEVPDIDYSDQFRNVAIEIGKLVAKELEQYSIDVEFSVDDLLHNDPYEIESVSIKSETKGDQIIRDWIETQLNQDEGLTVSDIALLMNFELMEESAPQQWYRLKIAFERLGYGIAPDFALWTYHSNPNYPVLIYKSESTPIERVNYCRSYLSVLLAMVTGFILLQPKDANDEQKLLAIAGRIEAREDLTHLESERLITNFKIMRAVPPKADYFNYLLDLNFALDSEFIRETIREYVEVDGSLLTECLDDIMLIYNRTNLDYNDVATDLNLPDHLKMKFNEYAEIIWQSELEKANTLF